MEQTKQKKYNRVEGRMDMRVVCWLGVFLVNAEGNLLLTPGFMLPSIFIGFPWIKFGEGTPYPTSGNWRSPSPTYIVSIPITQVKSHENQTQALLVDRNLTVNQMFYKQSREDTYTLTIIYQQPQWDIQGEAVIQINGRVVLLLRMQGQRVASHQVFNVFRTIHLNNQIKIRGFGFPGQIPKSPNLKQGYRIISIDIQAQKQKSPSSPSTSKQIGVRGQGEEEYFQGKPYFTQSNGGQSQFGPVFGNYGQGHPHYNPFTQRSHPLSRHQPQQLSSPRFPTLGQQQGPSTSQGKSPFKQSGNDGQRSKGKQNREPYYGDYGGNRGGRH